MTLSTIPATTGDTNLDCYQAPARAGTMPQDAGLLPPSGAKAQARALLAALRTLQAVAQA